MTRFWDDEAQAFFDTASDAESLVTRPRDVTDNAIPSGSSLAIELLLVLGDLFGDERVQRRARGTCSRRSPSRWRATRRRSGMRSARPTWRCAARWRWRSPVIRRARNSARLASAVSRRYVPSLVLAGGRGKAVRGIALLEGRERGEVTAYVCRAYACDAPTSDPGRLSEQLEAIRR